MDDVVKVIKGLNILADDYVVLACSYGPDSMCLLDILRKENINIVVAHVNHNLREEARNEFLDLKKYCEDNNLIFEGAEIKEKILGNIEAGARDYRYNFFDKIVKKYKAKYLFTAHHGDDLVETVLMRISRGASFSGYAGFKMINEANGYKIIRPLICVTKDEIIKYTQENKIPYAIDSSNLSLDYTRNKFRYQVLPELKDINPNIHKKFIKFSDTINEYNDYLESEVYDLYSKLYNNKKIDLNEFVLLPVLLKKCILKKILINLYKESINKVNDRHIILILNLIDSNKVNGFINLPDGILVKKYYNILEFGKKDDNIFYNYVFDDCLEIYDWSLKIINSTDIIKSNYLIRLSSKDIKMPLYVRSRITGDKMLLKNGSKKVGEILSEAKISKTERDRWPIVCDADGKILWIPGVKKSKFDIEKNKDYDIIIKYVKKGEEYEKKK